MANDSESDSSAMIVFCREQLPADRVILAKRGKKDLQDSQNSGSVAGGFLARRIYPAPGGRNCLFWGPNTN